MAAAPSPSSAAPITGTRVWGTAPRVRNTANDTLWRTSIARGGTPGQEVPPGSPGASPATGRPRPAARNRAIRAAATAPVTIAARHPTAPATRPATAGPSAWPPSSAAEKTAMAVPRYWLPPAWEK